MYEDFFGRFLNKLRAGKIDPHEENSLEWATSQFSDDGWVSADTKEFIALPYTATKAGVKWVGKKVEKKKRDIERFFNYDRHEDLVEEEEVEVTEKHEWDEEVPEERKEKSFFGALVDFVIKIVMVLKHFVEYVVKKVKKVIDKAERALRAKQRLDMWRSKTINGLNYGQVRDFMIDEGVIDMFQEGRIFNTT